MKLNSKIFERSQRHEWVDYFGDYEVMLASYVLSSEFNKRLYWATQKMIPHQVKQPTYLLEAHYTTEKKR